MEPGIWGLGSGGLDRDTDNTGTCFQLPTWQCGMWDSFLNFWQKKNKRIYKVQILKSDDLRLRSGNTNYAAAKKRRVWLVAGVRCSLCCVQFPILAINIDKLYGE